MSQPTVIGWLTRGQFVCRALVLAGLRGSFEFLPPQDVDQVWLDSLILIAYPYQLAVPELRINDVMGSPIEIQRGGTSFELSSGATLALMLRCCTSYYTR